MVKNSKAESDLGYEMHYRGEIDLKISVTMSYNKKARTRKKKLLL